MCVDHRLARRPGEDGKAPVLRRDEGDRVALIVDELRRGQVSGAAKLRGVNDRGDPAFDQNFSNPLRSTYFLAGINSKIGKAMT